MATILKCKMCGGDIEVNSNMTIGTCLYCGSTMTLPRIDSDKKARLFNMANQYRLNNEFDRAYDAYHDIATEDENEAEAYWGMLLAEYGVEYVEDPKTKKRVPTCHRTSVNSIMSSANYELALKYTDVEGKMLYRDEALRIDTLQKKILSVSLKEEPYDIFICYKETDDSGERTEDSVLAQEIYDRLIESGYKVFFSRITLKDKLGEDYEPYIYSALKSAKVMLLVTTSYENASAVWVKNEWMRYIGFMRENVNKTLIPVCKGMKAIELPNELNRYQAQEMDKIGSMQDLLGGVKSLISTKENSMRNDIIDALINDKIKRDELEKQQKIRKEEETKLALIKKEKRKTKRKAARIAGITVLCVAFAVVISYFFMTKWMNPNIQYHSAINLMNDGEYDEAAKIFTTLENFRNSRDKIIECNYLKALGLFNNGEYTYAYSMFANYENYSDSLMYMRDCAFEIQLYQVNTFHLNRETPAYRRFKDDMSDTQLKNIASAYHDAGMDEEALGCLMNMENYSTDELYLSIMNTK